MLNEVNLIEKDKIISDFSHMWNQKKQKQMNIRKWKQVQRYRENLGFLRAVAGEMHRITDGD